ncbi:MAG: hypothetical protein ACK4Z5_05000 [Brevundimonas sp.]
MTRTLSTDEQKEAIEAAFRSAFGPGAGAALGRMRHVDRVYELRCLLQLIDKLSARQPYLRFVLSSGSDVMLRSKGGPIDRNADACVEVQNAGGAVLAELWSNVEFWALSYVRSGRPMFSGPTYARAHELDLVLLSPGVTGRPTPDDILIGVEAKHRPYGKSLLKELLGIRREMTFRGPPRSNPWQWWSPVGLQAKPPSGLVSWCAYPSVTHYTQASDYYGILMEHLPL